jgi:hypothetical protein
MPTCRGTRLDGRPCGHWAIRGTEYCWQHGPDAAPRPSSCRICRDPRRAEIEAALAAGASITEVARRFRLAPEAPWYHRRHHLPPAGAEGAG